MAKIINKTLTKTKAFFKAKPTRIIIALSIIAAIMIGAALGIMALARAITDKCANQPGTEWNADLNKCVPRSCKDGGYVCTSKNADDDKSGNCIPKDYCSTSEGNYVWDPDSCECIISCEEGKKPFGRDSSTKYIKPPIDDTNKMYCGYSCPTATKENTAPNEGGDGYCLEPYLCGYTQLKGKNKIYKCFDNEDYAYCDHKKSLLLCPLNKDGDANCTENKQFCKDFSNCEETGGKVLCRYKADCKGEGNECVSATEFTTKNFQTIRGTCKYASFIEDYDHRCIHVSLDEIGEACDGQPVDCSSNSESIRGVSNQIQQCVEFLETGTRKPISSSSLTKNCDANKKLACAYEICSTNNNQQAIYSDMEESKVCEKTISACPSGPSGPSGPCYLTSCCEYPTSANKCCQVPTTATDNPDCRFITPYPIDAGALTPISGKPKPTIGTPLDASNYSNYEDIPKQLARLAGSGASESDFEVITTGDHLYHAYCGYNFQYSDNEYMSSDYQNKTSICKRKNTSECKIPASNSWLHGTFAPLKTPLCQDHESNLYWSGYNPMTNKDELPSVSAIKQIELTQCNNVPYSQFEDIAAEQRGIQSISLSQHEGTSNDYTLEYTYNCENMDVEVGDKSIPWKELSQTDSSSNFVHPEVTKHIRDGSYRFAGLVDCEADQQCTVPSGVPSGQSFGTRYVDDSITRYLGYNNNGSCTINTDTKCNAITSTCSNTIYPSNKMQQTLQYSTKLCD